MKLVVFPGTVTNRGDEFKPESSLNELDVGLWKRSCAKSGSESTLVAW